MKVILISGKAQNGKDATAEIMKKVLNRNGKKALITHYGDLVKYICKTFFDWNGEKDEAGRTLLQYVGTDVVRAQDTNYWVNFIKGVLTLFNNHWDYVLIPDCRFPNEIDLIKKAGFDTIHIRVDRGNFDNGLSQEQKAHPSETALDNVVPDIYIHNHGSLEELEEKVVWVLNNALTDFQLSIEV